MQTTTQTTTPGLMTTNEFQDAAERYMDTAGLDNALGELAEVCRLKAQHLRESWQDSGDARLWEQAARIIDVTAGRNVVSRLSGRSSF